MFKTVIRVSSIVNSSSYVAKTKSKPEWSVNIIPVRTPGGKSYWLTWSYDNPAAHNRQLFANQLFASKVPFIDLLCLGNVIKLRALLIITPFPLLYICAQAQVIDRVLCNIS